MGVVREYFVRDDDEHGARLLNSGEQGVIGMCPITELVGLEASLMDLPIDESTSLQLMSRPDHDVVVAHDEHWEIVINKIADHTTALIASATTDQLDAAAGPWSQIEEFAGHVTASDLAEVMVHLQPLFRQAVEQGFHVYVRTSC